MTTYSAARSAAEDYPIVVGTIGAYSPPVAALPRKPYVHSPYLGSGLKEDAVFPVRHENDSAVRLEGVEFWDIINGKILIRPSRYDLGLVAEDVWRTGLIWNNRAASATVLAINAINDQNIVLSGIEDGMSIAPRQDNTHTYLVQREGPATIDARFEFDFGVGDVTQTLTGLRGVVFPLRPRDLGYSEGREWHTSLFRSDNGTERRATLTNATPPRTVRFPLRAHRWEERAVAENLLRFGARYSFLVPLWFSASQLTAPANGGNVLSAPTTDREFAVDGYLALIRRDRNNPYATIRQISSLTSSSITVTEPVSSGQFAAGDWCIPAIIAAFPQGANWADRSSSFGDLLVAFEEL